jgi:hypothetical protein
MAAVNIQVITYAPTVFYHCQHCELTFQQMGFGERVHREEYRESLPDDLRAEFQELSDWVHDLAYRYGDRIHVRVIDAASLEGFWKSLRYRVRRYPAVIVNGSEKRVGTDFESIDPVIERCIAAETRSEAPELALHGNSDLRRGGRL